MTLTLIDPKTALLVIDLQKGVLGHPMVHPLDDVIANTNRLSAAFRKRKLPVVLVVAAGGSPGRVEQGRPPADMPRDARDLLPGLEVKRSDHRVTKLTRGAFTSTRLDKFLRRKKITQVVLAGVATSNGVEATARHAFELGFNVTFATDAMTDSSAESHDHSVEKIFPRFGERGTTDEIIALLGRSHR